MDKTLSGIGQHGYWFPVDAFGGHSKTFTCSVCGAGIEVDNWTTPEHVDVDVCPVCGAEMVQEDADE